MIPTPAGWMRQVRGDHVHLRAPQGRPIGELRYREWYGPLRGARQITEERLAIPVPTWELGKVGAPERLKTHEGEHAALVRIDGVLAGRPALRLLGIVFGDYHVALIDAMSVHGEYFDELDAVVRGLVRQAALVLGVRRRRYVYRMPPDWYAVANVLVTHYYPPDFPRRFAHLFVYPALPAGETPQQLAMAILAEQRGRGATITNIGEEEPITSRAGLHGRRWRVTSQPVAGQPFDHTIIVFEDAAYVYPLRLDVHVDAEGDAYAVFQAVCDSVEPLAPARAAGAEAAPGTTLDFWAL